MKIFIQGTDVCNLDCAFCINKAASSGKHDLEKVVASVASLLANNECERVMISGGEPLADREYLDRMLAILWPYKDSVAIDFYTNGLELGYEMHLRLAENCRKLTYVFGVSPVPYKSLDRLLSNPAVMRIVQEEPDAIRVNYVIPEPENIYSLVEDHKIMSELGIWHQLTFNKSRFKEAKSYYQQLRETILLTDYKPNKKNMCDAPLDCDMVTVECDGTIRGCKKNQTSEQLRYADLFLNSFCQKCRYKEYCSVCRPSLCRANFDHLCYLNYALCANLKEEELAI